MELYRSETEDGNFERQLKLPEVGMCHFMKKFYKKHFYESVKDYSNMPHYDTCPVMPKDYWIKDCPFDMDKFKNMMKEGYMYMSIYAVQGDVVKWFLKLYGHITKSS